MSPRAPVILDVNGQPLRAEETEPLLGGRVETHSRKRVLPSRHAYDTIVQTQAKNMVRPSFAL